MLLNFACRRISTDNLCLKAFSEWMVDFCSQRVLEDKCFGYLHVELIECKQCCLYFLWSLMLC